VEILSKLLNKVLGSVNDDPSLKWNWLMKHDGILTLRANGETREVYLYDKLLDKEKAAQAIGVNQDELEFEWGTTNEASYHLAFTLLYQFMSEGEAISYTEDFCKDFIAKLPEGNVETEFSLEYWRNKLTSAF